MNNRYLFRGKRLDKGEWVYGYYTYHEPPLQCIESETNKEKGHHLIIKTGFADWNMPRPLGCYPVNISTVGQCTGLAAAKSYRGDKPEDRLVFEGDIIYSDWSKEKYIITWDEEELFWKAKNIHEEDCEKYFDLFLSEVSKIEIIGTVWENPELLEGSMEA